MPPFADEIYACALCHDIGFVVHPVSGELLRCACKAEDDRRRAYERGLAASNFTPRMRSMTFETFNATRAPEVTAAVRAFAEDPQGWLYLYGGYGAGKTHLLAAAGNALLAAGRHPLYVVAPDFLAYVRAGMHNASASSDVETRIQQAIEADVLLLDDLGAEHDTGWAQEQFYRVLNGRYMAETPTIVASNLWLEELPPRIASRLNDRALVTRTVLTCEDYRPTARRAVVTGVTEAEVPDGDA